MTTLNDSEFTRELKRLSELLEAIDGEPATPALVAKIKEAHHLNKMITESIAANTKYAISLLVGIDDFVSEFERERSINDLKEVFPEYYDFIESELSGKNLP
jgi:hypothetical protein